MPLKPICAGFKVYALAQSASGFLLNFQVHRDIGRRQRMVDIAYGVIRFHIAKWHHIYCDKLYTSVELANKLFNKKTYLTGAVKCNTIGLLSALIQKRTEITRKLKQ